MITEETQNNGEKIKLKIAIIQVESIYKKPEETYNTKIKPYLDTIKDKPLDFIVFPETALMGYDFENREEIYPFCEERGKGFNFQVAKETAIKHNCYVALGYPEKEMENEEEVLYNSCYLVNREGELIYNYRKILLYHTDKRYFAAGKEDQRPVLKLETLEGKEITVGMGICMDINYKDFFEFPLANYCRDSQIEVLLFPTAWNYVEGRVMDDSKEEEEINEIHDKWAMRMMPNISKKFWRNEHDGERNEKEWIFVAADRCGAERNTCYRGSSYVCRYNVSGIDKPYLVESTMGVREEGVKYIETYFHR